MRGGIQLYVDPQNTKVHGNVIDGTGLGFYLSGAGNEVYNNIVLNTRGYDQTSATLTAPVVFSGWGGANNQFYDNGLMNAGALCFDCSGISYLANNQTGDPQFVDAPNHNYALKATGPVPASWGIWDGNGVPFGGVTPPVDPSFLPPPDSESISPDAARSATAASCRRPSKVQLLRFSAARYPAIKAHVRAAITKGWPRILVVNRPHADNRRNRLLAQRGLPPRARSYRDEYPPAIGRGRADGKRKALVRGVKPIGWMADLHTCPTGSTAPTPPRCLRSCGASATERASATSSAEAGLCECHTGM